MNKFTHIDEKGQANMVDITDKKVTDRMAVAAGVIKLKPETLSMIEAGQIEKGAVLETARVAGIMAVKKTSELIPLCHPLLLSGINIDMEKVWPDRIFITCTVRNSGQTGVEMEALQGVAAAALTIYDMCKAVDKTMEIGEITLREKRGGSSGSYTGHKAIRGQVAAVATSVKKGTKKKPLLEIKLKENHGILNDAHAGDWHRQVSLLAEESIRKMLNSTEEDLRIGYGDFAENITTRGVDIASLKPGDMLKFSSGVTLEVTQIGKECHSGCAISQQVGDCVMPKEGIFAKVITAGQIAPGDDFVVEVISDD